MTTTTSAVDLDTVLSDDELAAVAAELGGPWPLPLPTVAVDDGPSLEASALRGLRSLLVRGAIRADGSLSPALTSLAPVLGSTAAVLAYVGDPSGRILGWDFGYGAVETPDGWLLDDFSPLGLHRLAWVESADQLARFFGDVLEAVLGGEVPSSEDRALCLARGRGDGADVLAVGRGVLRRLVLDADARLVSAETTDEELATAVRRLLGR